MFSFPVKVSTRILALNFNAQHSQRQKFSFQIPENVHFKALGVGGGENMPIG